MAELFDPASRSSRRRFLQSAGALGATASMGGLLAACGGGDGSGGTAATTATGAALKPNIGIPYDASTPVGAKPSGLPRRFSYVAFSPDPFWVSFSKAMADGAEQGDIEFGDANAQGDAAKYLDLVRQQLTRGLASTFLAPIDARAEASLAQQGIDQGADVVSLSLNPGTTQIGQNQLQYGTKIGEAAARYINDELGGRAEILFFNEGTTVATLKDRYQAIRDAIRANAPGATIVKDLTPRNTADDGFKQASSAFAANPGIKVVIGPGLATVGAFSALESTGKATPDMYIASIGGTDDEIAAIRRPNSAYKATWAEPWLLIGYLCTQWTADWLDGRAVPMGLAMGPALVDAGNYRKYQDDMADPAKVIAEDRVGEYLTLWGNINYETRSKFYDGLWTAPKA
jgi:ribose transport system substrate-binding protein